MCEKKEVPPGDDPSVTPRLGGLPAAPERGPSPLLRTSKLVKVYRADGITVEAVREVDFER